MQTRTLLAAVVAAAFAFPLAANAGTDKQKSTSANGANDGGAAAMFKSLDKNGDGFISKEEAKGTPHEADFASLDKDGDGKLSIAEHASAKEHMAGAKPAAPASSASSSPSPASPSSSAPSGEKKTY